MKSQHRGMWGVSGVLIAWVASACHGAQPGEQDALNPSTPPALRQEAASSKKVLILGSSVSGGEDSREAQAAAARGYAVEVATPAQWSAKSAEEFMSYRALIIGDAACQTGESAFQAAIDSRGAWSPIVDGNVVIIGADPSTNGTPHLVENAIEVAAKVNKMTGLYVALGCAYKDAPAGTPVTLLEWFGTFKVAGVSCADAGHVFETYPDTLSRQLSDDTLAGNGCVARSVFTQYPSRNFAFAALGMSSSGAPVPGQSTYPHYGLDNPVLYYTGTPYVLVSGAMATSSGCGIPEQPADEECDLGDNLNGNPAQPGEGPESTCSWSCRNHWCGDGVVDAAYGEECDSGAMNGRSTDSSGSIGACTAFCKFTPAANNPPVARCKDVELTALDVCGMDADIDNGSSDPDGDLVGCTTSVAGPYPHGQTTVTQTCADAEGNTSSCTGTVTVLDRVVPTLTLVGPGSQQVECGGQYSEPGATAHDLCTGDMTSAIVKTGAVDPSRKGQYTVRYTVTDSAGNSPEPKTRQVRVADTLPPVLTLKGAATTRVECGTRYNELGVTAHDQCAGPLTNIETSGAVNARAPGDYTVSYRVTDPEGLSASATRKVEVRDTTAPSIECPENVYVEILEGSLTSVTLGEASATDTCDRAVRVSGNTQTTFPEGINEVEYTATDASGNKARCISTVTVMSLTLPDTFIVEGPAAETEDTEATFAFDSSKPNVTYECSLDGVDFFQCEKLHTFPELREGPHDIQVRARDVWNRADPTPATATWTVTARRGSPWDGALLGSGNGFGCTAASSGSASLAALGLVVLSLLGARKRQQR